MNQHLVSIFSVVKGEKVFQLMTGQASFDEVFEVLEQFKQDFIELKKSAEEQEAKRKLEEDATTAEQGEALNPEVTN